MLAVELAIESVEPKWGECLRCVRRQDKRKGRPIEIASSSPDLPSTVSRELLFMSALLPKADMCGAITRAQTNPGVENDELD